MTLAWVVEPVRLGPIIKIRKTRIHPDAVIKRQIGAENRVDCKIDIAVCRNTAPFRIIGFFAMRVEGSSNFWQKNGLQNARSGRRSLVCRLCQTFGSESPARRNPDAPDALMTKFLPR